MQSQEGTDSALFCTLSKSSRHQPKDNDALEPQSKEQVSPLFSKFIIILNIHKVH